MERGIPYAIGVVSFGSQDCGNKDKLGVYARVSSVLSWIKKNMNKRYKAKPMNRVIILLNFWYHTDQKYDCSIIIHKFLSNSCKSQWFKH